jgi:hypothetical protein
MAKNRSDDTLMDLWQRDAMIRWWTLFACVPHDSPADPKLASWWSMQYFGSTIYYETAVPWSGASIRRPQKPARDRVGGEAPYDMPGRGSNERWLDLAGDEEVEMAGEKNWAGSCLAGCRSVEMKDWTCHSTMAQVRVPYILKGLQHMVGDYNMEGNN